MNLRFLEMRVKNFGPYWGEQSLDLRTPEGSPLILIHGENTLGKTQLFSALRWCLYGTFSPRQTATAANREVAQRLNRPAKRSGSNDLKVEVVFEANGATHRLVRHALVDEDTVDVAADLRIDATVVAAARVDAEIGRLLHPQISEFFLFDAEIMQSFYERLADDRERDLIKNSIEAVLGIPALQLAQADVQALANDAMQRQAKAMKNAGEGQRIQAKLEAVRSQAESLERQRRQIDDDTEQAQRRLKDLREQFRVVEGLQADARDQEMLEAQLADGRREEEQISQEMKELLSEGWLGIASRPLQVALRDVEDANTRIQAVEKEITEVRLRIAALQDLASGGTCPTCSQPLPQPDHSTEIALQAARTRLAELVESGGGETVDLQAERRIRGLIHERTVPDYADRHRRLAHVQMKQYERKQALEAIASRLAGHSAAGVRQLGHEIKEVEGALDALRRAAEKVATQTAENGAEQQKLAKQLARIPGANPAAVIEADFYRYIDRVFHGTIAAYSARVRKEVEQEASSMFLSLIRDPEGYGGLRIAPDFQVDLLDTHGDPRPTSEGGKQLLALSLIGALKRAAVQGGPVVLDSPLARLDLEHRSHVLQRWVPYLGGQAVLLVQSGELTRTDASKVVGNLVGRAYELRRPGKDPEVVEIEQVA